MSKVLYIEDDLISARLLQKHLKLSEIVVDIALDAEQGLEHISDLHTHYDAILVDYYMPGKNGLELLADLQEQGCDIPCIMLTAAGDEQIAVQALKYGALDYIVKDGDRSFLELLPMVINQVVQRERLIEEKEIAEREVETERTFAETLIDITNALNSTLNLNKVLEYIVENVRRVVPHDGSAVLFLEDIRTARFAHVNGQFSKETMVGKTLPVAEATNIKVMLETEEPYIVYDFEDQFIPVEGIRWPRSCVGAPIRQNDKVIGFLNLYSREPNAFTRKHADRLASFAVQAAIAISNAQLYQAIESHNYELEAKVADRTEHLVRAKERVEAILDSSPDSVLLLRHGSMISSSNPSFFETFGYANDDMYGVNVLDLFTAETQQLVSVSLSKAISTKTVVRVEAVAILHNEHRLDVEVSFSPVKRSGEEENVVCTIRDISERKEIERLKDAFVSNVSHEMRTPITSLKLHHQLMYRADSEEKWLKHLHIAERETARLGATIEDLLFLSRMKQDAVSFRLEYIDLAQIVGQQVLDRQHIAAEKDLRVAFRDCQVPLVRADAGLIGQVCNVLLTNAMNYTPAGGSICVETVERMIGQTEWIGFSVKDTGIGIKKLELDRIFDRFYRGSGGRQQAMRGTGLGLSIAQQIVEGHGGRIEVDSPGVGQGSTFTVWLPN